MVRFPLLRPFLRLLDLRESPRTPFLSAWQLPSARVSAWAWRKRCQTTGPLRDAGGPLLRGGITGVATAVGGMLHTFPLLLSDLGTALHIAYGVVVVELLAIAFIRFRFMSGNLWSTIGQVIVGGGIVFGIGIWLDRIGGG